MADLIVSLSDFAFINHEVKICLETFFDYYGNVKDADTYFCNRLNSEAWEDSHERDKIKALVSATRHIDRLKFIGSKAISTQALQFPRGTDTIVPADIKIATYEIALRLLDEIDVDREVDNLNVTAQVILKSKVNYDRSWVPEHVRAGIPSAIAWSYLKPYLHDPGRVLISRIS